VSSNAFQRKKGHANRWKSLFQPSGVSMLKSRRQGMAQLTRDDWTVASGAGIIGVALCADLSVSILSSFN
jgi:hypothetical protein